MHLIRMFPKLLDASNNTVFIYPRTPTPAGGKSSSYTGNTSSGATTASNWSADTSSANATPGQPNGGINTTWINSLRSTPVELSSFSINDSSDPNKIN